RRYCCRCAFPPFDIHQFEHEFRAIKMRFSAVVTSSLVLAGLVAPTASTYTVGRWTPTYLATGQTTEAAVAAMTEPLRAAGRSSSAEAEEAKVIATVTRKSRDVRHLENALESSGGGPTRHDAAVLLGVLRAGDVSCGLEDTSTTTNAGGRGTCAAEYEQCSDACNAKRFYGWGKSPRAGTCQLVCAVAKHGCSSCRKKRVLHAVDAEGIVGYASARWSFLRSADLAQDILMVVIARPKALAWAIARWLLLFLVDTQHVVTLLILFFASMQTMHHKSKVLRITGNFDRTVSAMRRQHDSREESNHARIADLEGALEETEARFNEEERRCLDIEDRFRRYRELQETVVPNVGVDNDQDVAAWANGLVDGLIAWDLIPGFVKDQLRAILN
ncbi:unnamed protein product, partial [Pylaiella littoralis]